MTFLTGVPLFAHKGVGIFGNGGYPPAIPHINPFMGILQKGVSDLFFIFQAVFNRFLFHPQLI